VHWTHSPASHTFLPAMPLQCAFSVQGLHWLASQCEAWALPQSACVRHCTQVFLVLSQTGFALGQSMFSAHSTQVPAAVHTGFSGRQCVGVAHSRQVFVASLHMGVMLVHRPPQASLVLPAWPAALGVPAEPAVSAPPVLLSDPAEPPVTPVVPAAAPPADAPAPASVLGPSSGQRTKRSRQVSGSVLRQEAVTVPTKHNQQRAGIRSLRSTRHHHPFSDLAKAQWSQSVS
jgi:hypothetical protein